jgi:hypothetical protein
MDGAIMVEEEEMLSAKLLDSRTPPEQRQNE